MPRTRCRRNCEQETYVCLVGIKLSSNSRLNILRSITTAYYKNENEGTI